MRKYFPNAKRNKGENAEDVLPKPPSTAEGGADGDAAAATGGAPGAKKKQPENTLEGEHDV
jgi:hypothetical protein